MARARKSARKNQKSTASQPASQDPTGVLATPLDADSLRRLYQELLRCRMVGTRIAELFGWPIVGGVREAIAVGSSIDLQADDVFLSNVGSYAAALVRGASAASVLLACRARAAASTTSEQEPPSLTDRSEILLASGAALAAKLRCPSSLVTVVASAVPRTLGPWSEALRFAATRKLPIIYVIEVPAVRSSLQAAGLRSQAASFGLPGFTVDGHDLVAILRVCQEARQKARQGYGPTLIECCTFGDPAANRSKAAPEMVQRPANADPLEAMRHYLERRKYWDDTWYRRITRLLEGELAAAGKFLAVNSTRKGRTALGPHRASEREKMAVAELEIFANLAQ